MFVLCHLTLHLVDVQGLVHQTLHLFPLALHLLLEHQLLHLLFVVLPQRQSVRHRFGLSHFELVEVALGGTATLHRLEEPAVDLHVLLHLHILNDVTEVHLGYETLQHLVLVDLHVLQVLRGRLSWRFAEFVVTVRHLDAVIEILVVRLQFLSLFEKTLCSVSTEVVGGVEELLVITLLDLDDVF